MKSTPIRAAHVAAHRSVRNRRNQRGAGWVGLLLTIIAAPFVAVIAAAMIGALALLLANDRLPPLDALIDYKPKMPLRVFTADGQLIGEFGEERRSVVRIAEVPDLMKQAVLAAEDSRFFDHSGVDLVGVLRAALSNVTAGGKEQGASTITMQLARNFFLSSEKSYTRKIYEILLALKIEASISKEQILEIYMNQIFLGQRAYGFASAAQVYFGKPLAKLDAAEAAMLAGLPKAPSRFNPFVNPKRATERQHYILRRMHESGFLNDDQLQAAQKQELKLLPSVAEFPVQAPYVAELARVLAQELYKEDVYSAGLNVYTTILSEDQKNANAALKQGVLDYDRRYGYRGPESFIDLPSDPARAEDDIENAIAEAVDVDDFLAGVVTEVRPGLIKVSRGKGTLLEITGEGLKFVTPALSEKTPAARRLRPGAVVRVTRNAKAQWEIAQVPEVEAALVACNTVDGAVRALVGGFDFNRNKFNRVTQAWRQPGSSFKPFIYSASLEKGLMASTMVNDAPVVVDAAVTGSQLWEPKNYDGKFDGPMPIRTGLARSKNMVSIRILQTITPQFAQDYVTRFGFDADRHPPYLTMALGAGAVTPWQMVGAYSTFANGGYRIDPYIVLRITDSEGRLLAEAHPGRAGDEMLRAIDPRNAFIMDSLMRGVVKSGTATKAMALKRNDLAGKTGTTNDSHDAWFAGYQSKVAAIAWVGYDQPRKLGDKETGGGLALPIWMGYMGKALKGLPETKVDVPAGVVQVGGEYYYAEVQPGQGIASLGISEGGIATGENADKIRDQVF